MKAVMPVVPEHILAWRKQTGADCRDEMWNGVLHTAPEPNCDHQEFEGELETWLRIHWARPLENRVLHRINLAAPGTWPNDFRIPDLVLLMPDRFHINRNEYFDGGPNVVVEIRSPHDETYDKLPFYAALEVPEVWVFDRDTKQPELYYRSGGGYEQHAPTADGWLVSRMTGVEFRAAPPSKLECRVAGRHETTALLPE